MPESSMGVEEIARICHETNRGYCEALGDTSQPTWANAPQWQKDSVMKGVLHAQQNPDAKPSDSHESWLAENGLPAERKVKDAIFLAVARGLLASDSGSTKA